MFGTFSLLSFINLLKVLSISGSRFKNSKLWALRIQLSNTQLDVTFKQPKKKKDKKKNENKIKRKILELRLESLGSDIDLKLKQTIPQQRRQKLDRIVLEYN